MDLLVDFDDFGNFFAVSANSLARIVIFLS